MLAVKSFFFHQYLLPHAAGEDQVLVKPQARLLRALWDQPVSLRPGALSFKIWSLEFLEVVFFFFFFVVSFAPSVLFLFKEGIFGAIAISLCLGIQTEMIRSWFPGEFSCLVDVSFCFKVATKVQEGGQMRLNQRRNTAAEQRRTTRHQGP